MYVGLCIANELYMKLVSLYCMIHQVELLLTERWFDVEII